MVRRQAALVSTEGNFLRCIRSLDLLLGISSRYPIAIGQHAIGIDLDLGRDKHMVNAALGEQIRVKGVERTVLGKTQACHIIGVLQQSRMREDGINLIRLIHIEITRDDDWCALSDLADFPYNEFSGLTAGYHAHVIHVQVKEIEGLVACRRLPREPSPSADADTGSVPTESRAVGRLAQPKVTVVQQAQAVILVEDSGILTASLTIITPDTDIVIAIQTIEHIDQLAMEDLLCAKDVGRHEIDLVADYLTTLVPDIPIDAVTIVFISDVIGAHKHLGTKHL